MKTAMQIAIENIDQCLDAHDTKDMLINLLEKEREQLLNAFRDNSWDKSFNEYYEETYNQNK